MFRLLLQAGADIELKDHSGMTALEIAKWGSIRTFRRYVEREYKRRRAVVRSIRRVAQKSLPNPALQPPAFGRG